MVDLWRWAFCVTAKDLNSEMKSGVLMVVGPPAIKRDLLFGRKDEAHVIVTLVPVKMVSATLIKRDDVRTQSGLVFAFFLDRRNRTATGIGSLLARHV